MPECRHNRPWSPADAKRTLVFAAVRHLGPALLGFRSDGGIGRYSRTSFGFPQHNEVAGCCFNCVVTPAGIRDTMSAAPWRSERLGHRDLIARMRSRGIARDAASVCQRTGSAVCSHSLQSTSFLDVVSQASYRVSDSASSSSTTCIHPLQGSTNSPSRC